MLIRIQTDVWYIRIFFCSAHVAAFHHATKDSSIYHIAALIQNHKLKKEMNSLKPSSIMLPDDYEHNIKINNKYITEKIRDVKITFNIIL